MQDHTLGQVAHVNHVGLLRELCQQRDLRILELDAEVQALERTNQRLLLKLRLQAKETREGRHGY